MDSLLPSLLSSDNLQRQAAEAQFLSSLEQNPAETFLALLKCLETVALTQQASILLKRALTKKSDIPQLVPDKEAVYKILLNNLTKQLALVLAIFIANDDSVNLTSILSKLGQINSDTKLYAFNYISEYAEKKLEPYIADVIGLTHTQLATYPLPSSLCLVSLFIALETEALAQYQSVVSDMITVARSQSAEDFQEISQALIDLAESHPAILCPYLPAMISSEPHNLFLIVSIIESNSKLLKNNTELLPGLASLVLKYIITHTTEEFLDEDELDDVEEERLQGQEILTRLVKVYGDNIVTEVLSQISEVSTSKDITAVGCILSAMSSYGGYKMYQNLVQIIQQLNSYILANPGAPRLIWQCLNTTGALLFGYYELSDDVKLQCATDANTSVEELSVDEEKAALTKFTLSYAEPILSTILQILTNSGDTIMRKECTNTLLAISSTMPIPITLPYTKELYNALNSCLTDENLAITSLTAVSAMAQSSPSSEFDQFYGHFMPTAMNLLSVVQSPSDIGQVLDCIGLMGCAVDFEVFSKDAVTVLDNLITLNPENIYSLAVDGGEEAEEYLVRALARIVTAHEDQAIWQKYLPYLTNPLIAFVCSDVNINITDEDTHEGDDSMNVYVRGIGTKYVQFDSLLLQRKELSMEVLALYLDTFENYVLPDGDTILKHILTELDSPIHALRLSATGVLSSYINKGLVVDDMLKIVSKLCDQLFEEISDEEEDEMLTCLTSCISATIRKFWEVNGGTDNKMDIMMSPTYKPMNLNVGIDKIAKFVDLMRLLAGGEYESDLLNTMMDDLSESVGLIMKLNSNNPEVTKAWEAKCVPFSLEILDSQQTSDELKAIALFFFDDFIEYNQPTHQHYGVILPWLVKSASAQNYLLRQAACYGLSLLSATGIETQAVEQCLVQVVQGTKSQLGMHESATDNAVSGLVKLYRFTNDSEKLNQVLKYCPLKVDVLEARTVHYLLMVMFQEGVQAPEMQRVFTEAFKSNKGEKKDGTYTELEAVLTPNTRAWIKQQFSL